MNCTIRELREAEYPLLNEFLYKAIFIPAGMAPPPRSIVYNPELQVYLSGFGTQPADKSLAAEVDGAVVGAVWARIMDDYGHVDDETPSLAISLHQEYRGLGIGTKLMGRMLVLLAECGYRRASLAVQKANYAVKLYQKLGFEIVNQNETEYIMAKRLR